MEGDEELEKKANEFFGLKINLNFTGINPVEIDNLEEYVSSINYLVENGYIMERGDTVKNFRYVATIEGMQWFDKLRKLD